MYDAVKAFVLGLLRVEDKQPAPLRGHAEGEFIVVRPCPAYLRYRLFFWKLYLAAWGTGVTAATVALAFLGGWFLLLVLPLVGVAVFKATVLYVATRLSYETRWYVLTERSLLVREGVWVVREICLTFANVQNVYVKQGPVQRLFGFSNVEVDTAGGKARGEQEGGAPTHRASLKGLDDPYAVRDLVLDLLRRHRTTGLGDPDDHGGASPAPVLLAEIRDEARLLREAMARGAAV